MEQDCRQGGFSQGTSFFFKKKILQGQIEKNTEMNFYFLDFFWFLACSVFNLSKLLHLHDHL